MNPHEPSTQQNEYSGGSLNGMPVHFYPLAAGALRSLLPLLQLFGGVGNFLLPSLEETIGPIEKLMRDV